MKWTESVVVDRSSPVVLAAIANEHELMQWSAWPEATGYTCGVDGDGVSLGSSIVFTDAKGREQVRQRLGHSPEDQPDAPPLPAGLRHLAELLLARRVRKLHVEDLRLLKQHVERTPLSAST